MMVSCGPNRSIIISNVDDKRVGDYNNGTVIMLNITTVGEINKDYKKVGKNNITLKMPYQEH